MLVVFHNCCGDSVTCVFVVDWNYQLMRLDVTLNICTIVITILYFDNHALSYIPDLPRPSQTSPSPMPSDRD